jgi:hypothetical protein
MPEGPEIPEKKVIRGLQHRGRRDNPESTEEEVRRDVRFGYRGGKPANVKRSLGTIFIILNS